MKKILRDFSKYERKSLSTDDDSKKVSNYFKCLVYDNVFHKECEFQKDEDSSQGNEEKPNSPLNVVDNFQST